MGEDVTAQPLHSAAWFGDSRDHWWNPDFFTLLAQRWQLSEHRDVLDVGCGIGHWGRLLGRHLSSDARITGVDREAEWVRQATARAPDGRFSYVVGTVEALPFESGRFDLTTCQTVLMHMKDPAVALREMIRVTRPGGLVAVVEPNNLASAMVLDSTAHQESPDQILALLHFQMDCYRGRRALGEGDDSVGELMPELFAQAGLKDIRLFLNDKAGTLQPPYDNDEQRAAIHDIEQQVERELWIWDRAETLRYFIAGGGLESDFAPHWQHALSRLRRTLESIRRGTYVTAGGTVCYCVSGRKAG